MPWVIVPEVPLTISGVDAVGTRYGKPGYNHFILVAIILLVTFIPKVWAKRLGLVFGALNLAWGIRNFLVIGRCEAGDCPEKQWGLYLILIASVALMITTFFPNMRIALAGDKEPGEEA